jgi:AhpD family alkylhydroperoxidase
MAVELAAHGERAHFAVSNVFGGAGARGNSFGCASRGRRLRAERDAKRRDRHAEGKLKRKPHFSDSLSYSDQKGVTLEARIDYQKIFPPEALRGLYQVEHAVRNGGIEHKLLHLIKMRASQINGCAFCLDMHSKDARALGETEQRLYGLNAWRETPYYTDRERAALEWTEAITLISQGQAPDDVYERTRQFFNESEMAVLTLAAVTINSWNRIAIAFRAVPGSYQPGSLAKS